MKCDCWWSCGRGGKEMTRFINVQDIRWNFYECMENGTKESMADYFESLYYHYQKRGKRIKQLLAKTHEG